MEDEKKYKEEEIELCHREMSEILGDMPEWLFHTGSYIVYGLIILLLLAACWFKYPETVSAWVSIDDASGGEWTMASSTGTIDYFFVCDGDTLSENDTIGIMKNEAKLDDVRLFHTLLDKVRHYFVTNDISVLENFPFHLTMGSMTTAYEQLTQAVRTCMIEHKHNAYSLKKAYLNEELEILYKDSLTNELAILNTKRCLLDLDIEKSLNHAKHRELLEIAYEAVMHSLHEWEDTNLIRSNARGVVLLGKSWAQQRNVSAGDTIAYLMPSHKGMPVGHIRLNVVKIGEITVGDQVKIELLQYPAHHYGYVSGIVSSLSYIPTTRQYALDISFPQGLRTTMNKEIAYIVGLQGKAEIVTSKRSLFNKVFSPVYIFLRDN